jgi:PPM family protein phosphatase
LRLRYSVRSHVGKVREGNEDSAYAGSRLALVADGMGGHAAGEVASSAVVAALAQLDDDEAGLDLLEVLSDAVQAANDHLRAMVDANSSLDGMGTTLTAMLSSGTRLGLAHVGDSRAYLLRDGEFSQLTHDQTLVQRMVDEGRITPEQAETHPQRSLLTQALDGRAGVQPDLSVREARRGDRYLLCSDGLSGYVAHETIGETLTIPSADEAAERLVELALAAGAPDNVTVVIADVVDDEPGMPDTPVVGGAAAEQDAVPSAAPALVLPGGASLTPEERAAKREARRTGNPPPSPPPEPRAYQTGEEQRPVDTGVFRLPETPVAPAAAAGFELGETPPAGIPPITDDRGHHGHRHRRAAAPSKRWFRRRIPLAITSIFLIIVAGVLVTWGIAANSWYVASSNGQAALFHGLQSRPLGISLSRVAERGIPLNQLNQFDLDHVRGGIVADSHADGVCILARLKFNVEDAAHQAAAKAAANERAKASPSPRPSVSAKPSARVSAHLSASTGHTVTASARPTASAHPTPTPSARPSPSPSPTVSVPPATPLPKSCTR